ncbi:hypothetical protein [Chondrinema litorale]|uniref:hypothetical protein n=1 Tax=Chondrinema litorale TaxID=2994555 RepID=UPI002543C235|nr:hypothetical protein [Chondrinema litorale]UZR93255.1 hypothetical protein OQ292_15465 [Chondrinema litorale]
MNRVLLILLVFIVFVSCNLEKGKEITHSDYVDSKALEESDSLIEERYYPENENTTQIDTVISGRQLKITVTNTFTSSYVKDEYEIDGIKHIDKYRDSEKRFIIELSNEILLDTTFIKEDFVNYTGVDFLETANFHAYWFEKIEGDTIELFGVVGKPETDWVFAFSHYFDLKSRKFKVKEHIEDEM